MDREATLRATSVEPARRRLRVLDITKFYSAESGGVKTYLDAKIADFADREIEHTLVIPGAQDTVTERGRSHIYSIAGPRIPFSPTYRLMVSVAAVQTIIDRFQPDIIEVGSPFLVPRLVWSALQGRKIPTLGFYHSDLIRTYAEPFVSRTWLAPLRVGARNLARAYVRQTYRRFDSVIAASAAVESELRGLGIRRVRRISLGVDLDCFRPDPAQRQLLRHRIGAAPNRPIALYVGRFCMEKRLDVILAAHRALGADRPHLVLVGAGEMQAGLEREACLQADLSVLPYESNRAALARIFAGADFYIASGPGETFGLAIAEAMACGLPVVAVQSGAAPDRIAGSGCGRLYRHGSVESCSNALREMIGSLSDQQRARVRQHAEREFGWRATFDSLVTLYQQSLTFRAS
jgi:alpha-1,6-mannosyltransferase